MPDNVNNDNPMNPSFDSTESQKGNSPGDATNMGTPDAQPDKFSNKSREDVIRSYTELERKLGEQANLIKDQNEFISRAGTFFHVEGDKIVPNDEMIKRYAEYRGLIPKQSPQQNQQPNNTMQPQNNDDSEAWAEKFQENPKAALDEYVKGAIAQALEQAIDQKVSPLQQQFQASQHQSWIEKAKAKYPDFDEWRSRVSEFITKRGITPSSYDDLEDAYLSTKAVNGALIDKAQHEKHIGDLEKTLSTVIPNAVGRPVGNPDEMSTEQLLGLDRINSEKQKNASALFGKSFLKE